MRGNFHIAKRHVIATHTREKLFFVDFGAWASGGLPIFELPVVSAAKNSNHSTPLSITESGGIVIYIKDDFSLVYQPFDLDWLLSVSGVFDVVAFFQKLKHISSTKRTLD